MLGFDIESWLIAMRGQTLVMLGRGDEARPYLDRIIEMDAANVDRTHHVIPSLAYVDLAWANGDTALAERHAERGLLDGLEERHTQTCVFMHKLAAVYLTSLQGDRMKR